MTDRPGPAPRVAAARGTVHLIVVLGCLAWQSAAAGLVAGSLALQACGERHAFCGTVSRPLDPTGGVPGQIRIHFEFYRHRAPGAARGTLVATEGGPGYPATLSRDSYLALFAPLLDHRDLVLMDNRGTGLSDAVDCPPLQQAERQTVELNGACGDSLGSRAPLYSSAYAADDLAALLDLLGVARIDLYGDSYGTFFEQAFALRHPTRLRSIVLDGAYPLDGPDYAWYPTYAPAMRDKFERLCQRSPGCAAQPGTSIERASAVLGQLRGAPFDASAFDSDGQLRHFRADAAMLATVMFASAPALVTGREFDAAIRAFGSGDQAPLLRLMAETASATDSRDPSGDARQFSAGLAIAVMCQDAPQVFDMRLPVAARRADRDHALAQRRSTAPDTYAPFSIDEYLGLPLDYGFLEQCIEWPPVPADHAPAQMAAPPASYPHVPALILSGDLDNITTPQDGAAVAAAFPGGRQVLLANSFHVNALPRARSSCGAELAREFIRTLGLRSARCAAEVPPVRLVDHFALQSDGIDPATPEPGNQASAARLRTAATALLTVGDVLARLPANDSGHGVGLRGGSFEVAQHRLQMQAVRWSMDVAVSGTVQWQEDRQAPVIARVHVASHTGDGDLVLRWTGGGGAQVATLRGRLDGSSVIARAPAP